MFHDRVLIFRHKFFRRAAGLSCRSLGLCFAPRGFGEGDTVSFREQKRDLKKPDAVGHRSMRRADALLRVMKRFFFYKDDIDVKLTEPLFLFFFFSSSLATEPKIRFC